MCTCVCVCCWSGNVIVSSLVVLVRQHTFSPSRAILSNRRSAWRHNSDDDVITTKLRLRGQIEITSFQCPRPPTTPHPLPRPLLASTWVVSLCGCDLCVLQLVLSRLNMRLICAANSASLLSFVWWSYTQFQRRVKFIRPISAHKHRHWFAPQWYTEAQNAPPLISPFQISTHSPFPLFFSNFRVFKHPPLLSLSFLFLSFYSSPNSLYTF